ncbi:MAG: LysR family transcriptional regulator [Pseudomonadota bacterium]
MDKLTHLDWSLIRSFLAVAEEGSLSGAAQKLGLTQPTLGRHIRELEAATALDLFHRNPRGLTPTEEAFALLPAARAMRDASEALGLTVAGQSQALEGAVRITASETMALEVLPSLLAEIRATEPGISLDLLPTDTTQNLLFREADIAVRMFRPREPEVITRHIADLPIGLYVHRDLLPGGVVPTQIDELLTLPLVGRDRSLDLIEGYAAQGITLSRDAFQVRCDCNLTGVALVEAGCGMGAMLTMLGDRRPSLVRLLPDLQIPPLEVWLTAAEALRRTPRIRRVYDLLATGLTTALA